MVGSLFIRILEIILIPNKRMLWDLLVVAMMEEKFTIVS
jgi:hypothetical protein